MFGSRMKFLIKGFRIAIYWKGLFNSTATYKIISHSTDSQVNSQSDWLHRIALKMTLVVIPREISEMEILVSLLFDISISGFS